MKIYHLYRTGSGRIGYNEYDAMIVVAKDENEARKLANECDRGGFLGGDWNCQASVKCEEVKTLNSRVILGSFNAG